MSRAPCFAERKPRRWTAWVSWIAVSQVSDVKNASGVVSCRGLDLMLFHQKWCSTNFPLQDQLVLNVFKLEEVSIVWVSTAGTAWDREAFRKQVSFLPKEMSTNSFSLADMEAPKKRWIQASETLGNNVTQTKKVRFLLFYFTYLGPERDVLRYCWEQGEVWFPLPLSKVTSTMGTELLDWPGLQTVYNDSTLLPLHVFSWCCISQAPVAGERTDGCFHGVYQH